tara:strand:- start:238 stop:456 length:219 start_codon:yes stop_codon:yes gene_type:complete
MIAPFFYFLITFRASLAMPPFCAISSFEKITALGLAIFGASKAKFIDHSLVSKSTRLFLPNLLAPCQLELHF